jgi:hypothetical protein
VSLNVSGITVISAGRNAWHGFWGIVMCLALVALLAWLIAQLAGVTFSLPVSEVLLVAVLALVVLSSPSSRTSTTTTRRSGATSGSSSRRSSPSARGWRCRQRALWIPSGPEPRCR